MRKSSRQEVDGERIQAQVFVLVRVLVLVPWDQLVDSGGESEQSRGNAQEAQGREEDW